MLIMSAKISKTENMKTTGNVYLKDLGAFCIKLRFYTNWHSEESGINTKFPRPCTGAAICGYKL